MSLVRIQPGLPNRYIMQSVWFFISGVFAVLTMMYIISYIEWYRASTPYQRRQNPNDLDIGGSLICLVLCGLFYMVGK